MTLKFARKRYSFYSLLASMLYFFLFPLCTSSCTPEDTFRTSMINIVRDVHTMYVPEEEDVTQIFKKIRSTQYVSLLS